MELEGLKRCLKSVSDNSITVRSLTTDGHPHIESHMKKTETAIAHYFDAWHVAKGRLGLCHFVQKIHSHTASHIS